MEGSVARVPEWGGDTLTYLDKKEMPKSKNEVVKEFSAHSRMPCINSVPIIFPPLPLLKNFTTVLCKYHE